MAVEEPWLWIVLVGAAIAGWGWLLPRTETPSPQADASFERLLEDLEAENRELLEAVTRLKKEQDETVERLGKRIRELERDMDAWRERAREAGTPARESTAEATPGLSPEPQSRERTEAPSPGPAPEPSGPTPPAPAAGGTSGGHAADGTEGSADRATDGAAGGGAATTIRGRYAELLDLYNRGRSVEQIAKALNMNKGEVQLILQLAKREEGARA
jgi:hypothetical protein